MDFVVYQMDVKSAFLYDQTLFIRKQREDFILIQVYVDNIIFGSSNPQLCREVEALMHEKFQMSAMGELNFFLGLQVLSKEDGIFLSQDKPDIKFAICACARHQTIVATSTTEAEYVVAASCCGQVLWIQIQLLDYGHHFIRDCFGKKLISVDHIHTDENDADLLTKPFDAGRFEYLVVSIGKCKLFPLLGKLSTVSVFLGFGLTFAGTSKFWGILRMLMISLRRIPLFTARIETMEEGTKILATIDGIVRTVSESSFRRNLKLRDEEGISSLPDAELFENLTLMGYNISPNQKFTFQKG
nr:putative ribonuclease H-like domain-containing protein [Tanacetum cinerariifolium]